MNFFRLVVLLARNSLLKEFPVFSGTVGQSAERDAKPGSATSGAIGAAVFSTVLVVMLAVTVLFLKAIYDNIVLTGFFIPLPEMVFFIATALSWIIILFTALPGMSGLFFHAKETDLLRSLPVSSGGLTLARCLCVYLSFLPLHLLISLPACWSYYSYVTADKSHVAGLVTFLVVSPVIPLSIAACAAWVTDRLFNISRWKIAIQSASLFLVFLALVTLQLSMQEALINPAGNGNEVFVLQLAQVFAAMANAFPPATWVALSFSAGNGWVYFFAALLAAAVPAIGAFLLLSSRERRLLPAATIDPGIFRKPAAGIPKKRPLLASLVDREWSLLASSPYFAMEAVVTLAILPALLLLYGIAGPRTYLHMVVDVVTLSPVSVIVSCAILLLLLDAAPISASGFLREGKRLLLSRQLPVPGRIQVLAKLAFHLLLSLPSLVFSLAAIYLMFGLSAESLVLVIPATLLFFVMSFCLTMEIEFSPLLKSGIRAGMHQSRLMRRLPGNLTQVPVVIILAALAWLCAGAGMSAVFIGILLMELLIVIDAFLISRLLRLADRVAMAYD